MQRAGLTKAELARRCDVRWQTVHDWIRNQSIPEPDNWRSIAEATGVTLDELLGVAAGQDPPFPAWKDFIETDAGKGLSAGERRALQAFAWPEGVEPAVGDYYALLTVLRAAQARR